MANDNDDKLVRQAKALFDESVDALDGATLSKLNRARQRALEELDEGHPAGLRTWLLPAGGAAAVAALAFLVVGTNDTDMRVPAGVTAADSDFEMLIDENSLEMLEELEFYAWLELDEVNDAGHSG
ncbi:MAG: hypothetical protein V2I25_07920 [Woeseiaceae bacterium]|jgi:hypothetical protein|nr:hypothetical protein [Woeseiaceae bacterium]